MTPAEATKHLDLAPGAEEPQIEARYLELRTQLEDKIARALTPGLQQKYRAALAEATAAFEALILARESSSLPSLSQNIPAAPSPMLPPLPPSISVAIPQLTPIPAVPSAQPTNYNPPPAALAKNPSGSKLVVVAIIAVIVLGAGGWWVMQSRAAAAERTRLEAAARQQAERERQVAEAKENARVAAEAKAERDKQDKALAALRARAAEIQASHDSAQRSQQSTEGELTELKAQRDELSAGGKNAAELRATEARIQSRERYLAWLNDNLPGHPAKTARAQVTEALTARALETARPLIDAYAKAVRQLQADIARSRDELLTITGRLRVSSDPIGLNFTLTDAYGRSSEGRTPADLSEIPLGRVTLAFKRDGWPENIQTVAVTRGEMATASANLRGGELEITSNSASLNYTLTGQGRAESGTTPATLTDLPPGEYVVKYLRDRWLELPEKVTVRQGEKATCTPHYPAPGSVKISSTPTGAEVWRKGQNLGTTPLQLDNYGLGPVEFDLRLNYHSGKTVTANLLSGQNLALNETLSPRKLTQEEGFEYFLQRAAGIWVASGFGWTMETKISLETKTIVTVVTTGLAFSQSYTWSIMNYDVYTDSINCPNIPGGGGTVIFKGDQISLNTRGKSYLFKRASDAKKS